MSNVIDNCECLHCRLEGNVVINCNCPDCGKERKELEKEISEMSETHPFKVGEKVKIVNNQWNADKGLPDPFGTYPILAVHGSPGNYKVYLGFPRDCGVGSYCEDQSQVDSKYHGKYNGSWVNIDDVEKNEMKEKLLSSGKELSVAAGEGVKLAVASQGAEFGYQQLSRLVQTHLGLTKSQMENPVVKETIKTLTPVIFHMAATVYGEQLPYLENVKTGCELLIKDQARQHSVNLIRMFGPVLMEMATVMDPNQFQQRVVAEALNANKGRIDAPAPEVEAEAEAEAEEVALAVEPKQATA